MRRRVLGWVGIVCGGFILVSGGVRAVSGQLESGVYGAEQLGAIGLAALMFFAGLRVLKTTPAETAGVAEAAGLPLHDFAERYTDAWCSGEAARVASFFSKHGSLTINGGTPAVGRAAIIAAAQGFMTAFPDMIVKMDRLEESEGAATYHWTLIGTNTGPGGTGRPVTISGREEWVIGSDGLILDSRGSFDAEDYRRQLGG